MKEHATKKAIGMTVDPDVYDWIQSESAKLRLRPSQFVNSILARLMVESRQSNGANPLLIVPSGNITPRKGNRGDPRRSPRARSRK